MSGHKRSLEHYMPQQAPCAANPAIPHDREHYRARKCLGYNTPTEVYETKLMETQNRLG